MNKHTALPAPDEGAGAGLPEKPERPAAARWHKREDDGWLVKVRASVHREGREAAVRRRDDYTAVVRVRLGSVVAHDGEFVLSEFTNITKRPPRGGKDYPATEKQTARLHQLWDEAAHGGDFVSAGGHILPEPDWSNLKFNVASWYIGILKKEKEARDA